MPHSLVTFALCCSSLISSLLPSHPSPHFTLPFIHTYLSLSLPSFLLSHLPLTLILPYTIMVSSPVTFSYPSLFLITIFYVFSLSSLHTHHASSPCPITLPLHPTLTVTSLTHPSPSLFPHHPFPSPSPHTEF